MAKIDPSGNAFPELTNDCMICAALGEKTKFTPVWIMRQAGRYLPEFRELRSKHSFFEICETPELACEVTLMPIRRFNLDAAIIFSDILIIPQALGMVVEMTSEGPKILKPLKLYGPEEALDRLKSDVDIPQRLNYTYRAITITRHALEGKCPLIGFSGAPWTLMCYMVEGGGSKTMSAAKKWLYQNPRESEKLLDLLSIKVADHLIAQMEAGAQILQLFESNAEYLNRETFEKFSLPYIVKIMQIVRKKMESTAVRVPLIVFAKGAHYAMDLLGSYSKLIDVISLDWTMDPRKIRSYTSMCMQGNLDPCAMYADPDDIPRIVAKMFEAFGTEKYVANLGHGIYPDARIETVEAFVEAVHEISRIRNEDSA